MNTPGEIASSLYDVVCSSDNPGQYDAIITVCKFIESWNGTMDDLDRHNFLRLLICCSIAAIKCGKETMKRVCLCYSKLLIITRSYFNEYFKLGQAIVLLSEIVANNGPDSLIGCKFELPFDHSSNLIPIKQTISIETLQHIHALEQLWCFTINYIVTTTNHFSSLDLEIRNLLLESNGIIFAFINNLTKIRASGSTLEGACNSFLVMLENVEITAWSQQVAVNALLDWFSFATRKLCDSLDIDSLGSDPSQTRSDLLGAGYSITKVLIKMIKKWHGNKIPIRKVANDIIKILSTEIVSNNNIIFDKIGSRCSSTGTIEIKNVEFIVSRFISYLLISLNFCIQEDPTICPGFTFLLKCIVDSETHHAVALCVQSAYKDSKRNCEALFECLDAVGNNINPNTRQVRARLTKSPSNRLQHESNFEESVVESKSNNNYNDDIYDTLQNDIDNILKNNAPESPLLLSEMVQSAYIIIDKRSKTKLKTSNSKKLNNSSSMEDRREILLHFTICTCLFESILLCRQVIVSNIDSKQVIIDNRQRGLIEGNIAECYRDALFDIKLKYSNENVNKDNNSSSKIDSLDIQIHSQAEVWISITSLIRVLSIDDGYVKTNAIKSISTSSDISLLDLAYDIIEDTKQYARNMQIENRNIEMSSISDSISDMIWAGEGFLIWQKLLWLPCTIRLRTVKPDVNAFVPFDKISITDLTNAEQASSFYALSSQLLSLYEKYCQVNAKNPHSNSTCQPLSELKNIIPYIIRAFKMGSNILFSANVRKDSSISLFTNVFQGLSNIFSLLISLLYYSYPSSIVRSLQKCQYEYKFLLNIIDNCGTICNMENVELHVLRIQILSLIEDWALSQQIDIQSTDNSGSSSLIQDHRTFLHQISPNIVNEIRTVWDAIVAHNVDLFSLFESIPQESPDFNSDTNITNCESETREDIICKYEYTSCLALLRTGFTCLNCLDQSSISKSDSIKNTITSVNSEIDEVWRNLFRTQPKQFGIRANLSKFLTINMMDYSYKSNQYSDNNKYDVNNYGNAVGPIACKIVKENIGGDTFIEVSAFARFIKCSALTNPLVAIWAFSQLIDLFTLDSEKNSYHSLSELKSLCKLGILKPLFLSHLNETVDIFLVPLLNQEFEGPSEITQTMETIMDHVVDNTSQFFELIGTRLVLGIGQRFRNSMSDANAKVTAIFKGLRDEKFHTQLPDKVEDIEIYNVLMSPEIEPFTEKQLIKGDLNKILLSIQRALSITISDVFNFSPAEIEKILVSLIWDLGSNSRKKAALKALKVISVLFSEKSWVVKDYIDNDESNDCVANYLSTHFLLCMAHSIQLQWTSQTPRQQEQSVRSLTEIILLFRETDIIRYLPKIITFLDSALASTSPRVKLAATVLTTILCKRLPSDVLSENFLSLVVGLFPIVESSCQTDFAVDLAMADLKRQIGNIKRINNQQLVNEPTAEFLDDSDEPSCKLSTGLKLLCNFSFAKQLSARNYQKAKTGAIKLLTNMFLNSPIENAIQKIPYLPNIPELKEVNDMHSSALKSLSVEQTLELLSELLRHESHQVRIIALNHITETFRDHRTFLYFTISSATVYVPDHYLSIMFQEILQLCGRESDGNVKAACGKCLGEIGALDPARVINFMPPSSKVTNKSSKQPDNYHTFCPWEINEQKFGFYLLESHLVPALRKSPLSQDRIGFAIQENLKKLAGKITGRSDTEYQNDMPKFLDDFLVKAKIKDVTAPFWKSRYKLQDTERHPPIYKPSMNFNRWIGYLVRYLATITTGPLRDYFHSCRGVFMQSHEFSQVILPHIIMDVLINGKKDVEHNIVVTEFRSVLSGGEMKDGSLNSDEGNDMAVQSVFTLLDTLSSWGSKFRLKKHKFTNTAWSKAGDCIQKLLDDVPKELLGRAAIRIKAYTRALRYFEISMRENHIIGKTFFQGQKKTDTDKNQRVLRVSTSSSLQKSLYGNRNDGSNGVLPNLASSELDYLVTIFAKLEDPDVLQGIQVLRQVQGFPSTPWNRILELEQTDDWLGALVEYGLMDEFKITGPSIKLPSVFLVDTPGVNEGNVSSNANNKSVKRNDTEPSNKKQKIDQQESNNNEETVSYNFVEAERGRLRCLLELGHLDAIIDQIIGVVDRIPVVEQALLPLGIEAAWRLTKWDSLGELLDRYDNRDYPVNPTSRDLFHMNLNVDKSLNSSVSDSMLDDTSLTAIVSSFTYEDEFNISLGRLMTHLNTRNKVEFDECIALARQSTMSSLSAATMESYGRAYPYLTRLHILQELESGFELLQIHGSTREEVREARESTLQLWKWDERLEMMSPSQRQRSTLLACRRSILTAADLPHLVADNWLGVSKAMLHLGRFDAASFALRNAESAGLNSAIVLLQECEILKESGQINKALMLLEPVEPDLDIIRSIHQSSHSFTGELNNKESRLQFANRMMLATKLMVDSRQKHGKVIQDRYRCVIKLYDKENNDQRQSPLYELGRYLEYQYHEAMKSKDSNSKQKEKKTASFDESTTYNYLLNAIKNYGQCLIFGNQNPTYITQALPRMLTLWFSFTAFRDSNNNSNEKKVISGRQSIESASVLKKSQSEVNEMIKTIDKKLDPCAWYTCMPQLVSRTGHSNSETLEIVTQILEKLLSKFPQQGIWHIAGLNHSFNQARKRIGEEVCRKAHQKLTADGKHLDAQVLQNAKTLFPALVELATAQPKDPKEKKMRWTNCPNGINNLSHFLIPTQAGMLKPKLESSRNQNGTKMPIDDSAYYNSGQLQYIEKFHQDVDVASSKAKPKTLYIHTTSGHVIKFLVKQEKTGDLRKDARIMDFNTVVNNILQEDPEGRKRSLRLRTYSVICLNEECGVLEWVNNTNCIRHLIHDAHCYNPDVFPPVNYKDIYLPFQELQEKDDIELMVRIYREVVTDNYRPYFHRWFIETFTDPTEWFDCRSRFTKSAAVWAAVGHVVGLGDRHSENILLDVTNGECVHVDFDCLFDKGLSLARPEIVPFRLTPNFVDAMGLTGVEGTFRRTMEVVLGLLRDNKETLLGVIEPFIRDPTVAWNRSGRAQRASEGDSYGGRHATTFNDIENADAMEALTKISERLNGVYNLAHPNQEKLLRACNQRKQQHPSKGLGALKEEALLPLSVQGQVHRLISEATAEENLVQMYIGWQPWL